MANDDHCPHCDADLRDEPIPEKHFELPPGADPETYIYPYGKWDKESGDPQPCYKREIGVQILGAYDGVLFWACPDCGGCWHRWPRGHPLYKKACTYMEKWDAREKESPSVGQEN